MKTIIDEIQERHDYSEDCGLAGIGYHGADAHKDRDTLLGLLREVGEVVDILEEAGEYCDCSCGTGHARLIKKALNRGDV